MADPVPDDPPAELAAALDLSPRPPLTPLGPPTPVAAGPTPQADPAEPEVAWRSYAGRAMLPSFVVCGVVTLALLTGGWFLEDVRVVARVLTPFTLFGAALALWAFQLARWGYRVVTFNYRITPRHVFIDRGFLYRPEPPVELAAVRRVAWGAGPFERLLGAGWVRFEFDGDREPVTLEGVRGPCELAEQLRELAREARLVRV
jgi:membrane protein YdbS with pleckstrin-like domain